MKMIFKFGTCFIDLSLKIISSSTNLVLYHLVLTVGTYSEGNLLVVYEMRRQVFPTAPSPTTTHFIVCIFVVC